MLDTLINEQLITIIFLVSFINNFINAFLFLIIFNKRTSIENRKKNIFGTEQELAPLYV